MSQSRKRASHKAIPLDEVHREFIGDKEFLFAILENLPDAILITRLDGSIVYANQSFNIQYGGDITTSGLNIKDVYQDPEERRFILETLRREGHLENYELQARTADGNPAWALFSARQLQFEGETVFLVTLSNFTERKLLEEALRYSKEYAENLIETANAIIVGLDLNGNITIFNQIAEEITGYSLDELQNRNWFDAIVPKERYPDVWTEFLKLTSGEIPKNFENPILTKTGEERHIAWQNSEVHDHGQIVGTISFGIDITKHKRTEENLTRQVERLQSLHTIEQAIVGSMELDTILEILVQEIVEQLHFDAAAVLILNEHTHTLDFAARQGFRTEALRFTSLDLGAGLAGRAAQKRKVVHIENLVEIDDNPVLIQSIADEGFVTYYGVPLVAKGQLRGVMEIFHRSPLPPDPEWLPFLETLGGQAAISIDNARLLGLTQTQLKETEALYRINQGLVASIDPAKLINDVVDLLQKNFGYFYVQIFVRELETGDFIVRAGSGAIGEQLICQGYRLAAGEGIIGYTAETGTPFFTNDVDNVFAFKRIPLLPDTKSELAVPIRTAESFLGLLDVHQAPPFLLTQSDLQLVSAVADQLAVALQQAQLYADLQDSLRQERAMRSQLIHSEKLAVAGRLLASVAHELNNPLQAIQNALFLLKDEEGISPQGKQDLNIVLSETERMGAMLERLRVTYQPARAEDFQPVRMNAIIKDVHTLVATHLRHAQVSFESDFDPDLPTIPGVADQLRQVILNLFMNAVDAMATGGRLLVSTSFLAENNEVLISVSDTGTGIDPVILPHIFEPFRTGKEKGTGLGLSISYDLIFNHGGRIQAENNPEGGATFHAWLPAGNGGGK